MVTYPYAYMTYVVSPLAGLGGGISWRPPAYSLLIVVLSAKVGYTVPPSSSSTTNTACLTFSVVSFKRSPLQSTLHSAPRHAGRGQSGA